MSTAGAAAAASQPLLAIGEVRHARLRPAPNRFAYPTFFLMLPMRALRGAPPAALARNRFGLLSFHDVDHGQGEPDALAWVEALLAREGVSDADGEIWLQTYPRVLGYVFKPVSFWYAHRRDGSLAAVLAEVNNTFGERHCYLLAEPDGGPLPQGREMSARKVFHVSPFCSVEGDYRFRFFNRADRALARIDYHDADGPLLLTSLSGELVPADRAAVRRALFGQPLFTVGVVARIHWHALKLWLARVPFHRKPEPPEAFVSRGDR
jgi:DUF1365 family protein